MTNLLFCQEGHWRDHQVSFENQPFNKFIQEINKITHCKFQNSSPWMGEYRIPNKNSMYIITWPGIMKIRPMNFGIVSPSWGWRERVERYATKSFKKYTPVTNTTLASFGHPFDRFTAPAHKKHLRFWYRIR